MATTLGSDGVYFYTASTAPANPTPGQVYYNSSRKILEQWDGTYWNKVAYGTGPFKYRQLITTSYVMNGYQNGTPWKNVNRMVHSTDVCTNLGDQMVYTASYVSGAPSLTKGWVFAAANAHNALSNNSIAFNMSTETGIAYSASNGMASQRQDAGVAWKEHQYVHILSLTTTDKFNFTTETSALSGLTIMADGTGNGVSAIPDENYAGLYNDGSYQTLQFATDQITADRINSSATPWGNNNQQKPVTSKNRKGYGGNEGNYNGGYNFRVHDMITATQEKTVAKPMGNTGEENFDMGQEHQYCMGNYDGAQNNRGHKFYYATDSGYELGAGSLRTGVPGGSSGTCAWKG